MMQPPWAVSGATFELAPDTYLRHIYWYNTDKLQIKVPCHGWQHGIIWFTDNKGHVFCPYSAIIHHVQQNHFFIMESREPRATTIQMLTYMKKKWKERLFALPIHIANLVAPEVSESSFETPIPLSEYKPIKRESKRGKFLQLVLDGCVHLPTIAKTLKMSRNNVLSYFYQMQKVNGIEYTLNKELDTVYLYMPEHEVWT